MNFAGYKPVPVARWGSQVEWDDPTRLPLGVASVAQDMQYLAESVRTRYGLRRALITGNPNAITGGCFLKYTGAVPAKRVIMLANDGSLWKESPVGSGTLVAVADAFGLLNPNVNAQTTLAFDNAYFAFSDLISGLFKPAVINGGTLNLDPISQKPLGIIWAAATQYRVGDVISPSVSNGHFYRASAVAGDELSGAVEPIWPLTEAGVIVDNHVTWTEILPGFASTLPVPAQAGLARTVGTGIFAGGRDVYIKFTFTNDVGLLGETDLTTDVAALFVNTTPLVFNIAAPAAGAVRAANVVTITTTAAHGYLVGQTVTIAGVTTASFNGTFVIASTPTATTFTYAQVAVDATSGNGTSTIFKANLAAAPTGAVRAANVVTITTTGNHGYVVGQAVVIAGVTDGTYNGTFIIATVPTATTFTYVQIGANSTSGAGTASAGDRVRVTSPSALGWMTGALAPYKLTGYNVYEADVATGAGQPADTAFKLSNVWTIESAANSGAVRLTNVVTITTKTPHHVVVGQKVTVAGVTDATFNGTFAVVSTPAANTFTFAQVAADGTSGTGTATAPIPIGTNFNVDATANGVVGPVANDAFVVPVGNICAGIRWMVVLYENRNGYICGMSDPFPVMCNVASAGFSLYAFNLPIGPANTQARICAFTVAGDNRAGRYFYIPEDDSIAPSDINAGDTGPGIVMTSTKINDNVTTSATFNFIDDFLVDASEVTDFFDKIEVPECSDVYYSENLNRLVYSGIKGFPSSVYLSDEADPETVNLPGGEMVIAENNGGRVVCVRDYNEVTYIFKEENVYRMVANGPTPSLWGAPQACKTSGACGPRAVAVTNEFLIYVHQSGIWKSTGQEPEWVSKELQKTWKRINWGAKQKIWIHIDESTSEVSIGVPLDGATEITHRIRLNYLMGWDDPVVFSVRMGKLIPNVNGRKWSVEALPANFMFTADRDLTVLVNPGIDHRQQLYAGQDGVMRMEVPDFFSDEDAAGAKVGIDSKYQTVYADNPTVAILELGGATWSVSGNGDFNVTALTDKADVIPLTTQNRTCTLEGTEKQFDAGCRLQNEWISLQFDNGAVPDAWFEMHQAKLQMRVKWAARKS